MEKIVIYPVYFDIQKSRSDGRKVSEKYAVKSPKIEEIVEAAKKLGLNPVVEMDKRYPKDWFFSRGRVLVDKVKPKSVILKEIGIEIKKMRNEG